MTASYTMIAPQSAALGGVVTNMPSGATYPVAASGMVSGVAQQDVGALEALGFDVAWTKLVRVSVNSPLPADLVSIVAAVTPSNVALTLAAQPPQPRKLQIRIVVGTTTTTAITAGNLALVGVDQDGNAVSENISLIQNASATVKSANCYASLTSATVSGYTANGSGTGNTIGIGQSNDFGIPTRQGAQSFALVKSTKTTIAISGAVTGISWATADDAAASATVDAVARTVAPTTAPNASGLIDYEFTASYI